MNQDNDSLIGLIRKLLPHIHGRRKIQFIFLALLMLAGAVAELMTLGAVIPFIALLANPSALLDMPILKTILPSLPGAERFGLVFPMSLIFLGIVLAASLVRLGLTYASNRFVFALGHDIGVNVYRRILYQPYTYHVAKNSSEAVAGFNKVQLVVTGVLVPLMQGSVSMVISVAIMLGLIYIDAFAAITVGLTVGTAYLALSQLTRRRLTSNSRIIAKTNTTRIQCVQEGLGGIRDIILDRSHNQFIKQFSKQDQLLKNSQAVNHFIGNAPRYIIEAVGIFAIVGMAYSLSLREDGLTGALPVLGALALGAQKLLPLLQQFYFGWSRIAGNRGVLSDIVDFLELPIPPEEGHSGTTKSKAVFRDSIRVRDVSFSYPSRRTPILQGVNLEIPKGSHVGFVGRTGCGKTTLLDLIMGLMRPDQGQIEVDGVPINSSNRREWYKLVAHVPQSIFLTDGSIKENIAFGVKAKELDESRLELAVEAACLGDLIHELPDGLETMVGERGIRLSGGQRQRIGIARALYKSSSLLVLDEGTSALDGETELRVIRNIQQLDSSLTILMIAHRLESLRGCSLVVKLDEGQIVETGTFDQVIGKKLHRLNLE